MENMSLTTALSKHCRVEGETPGDFLKELKKLTDEDRAWFREQFAKEMNINCS